MKTQHIIVKVGVVMKRFVFCILVVSIILSICPVAAIAAPDESEPLPQAPQMESRLKDGYTLVPMSYGNTGVDIGSSFLLTVPEGIEEIGRAHV